MKRIFAYFFCSMIVVAIPAQSLKYGIEGGLNLSMPAGDVSNSGSTKMGYKVGGTLIHNLSGVYKGWYVSSGVYLIQKGYEKDTKVAGILTSEGEFLERGDESSYALIDKNLKWKETFLQVPFLLGKRFEVNQSTSIFAEAGLYAAYSLWASSTVRFDGKAEREVKEYSKYQGKTDVGLSLGIGLELKSQMRCRLGYDFGFIDMYSLKNNPPLKQDKVYSYYIQSHYNRSFNLTVAYLF